MQACSLYCTLAQPLRCPKPFRFMLNLTIGAFHYVIAAGHLEAGTRSFYMLPVGSMRFYYVLFISFLFYLFLYVSFMFL